LPGTIDAYVSSAQRRCGKRIDVRVETTTAPVQMCVAPEMEVAPFAIHDTHSRIRLTMQLQNAPAHASCARWKSHPFLQPNLRDDPQQHCNCSAMVHRPFDAVLTLRAYLTMAVTSNKCGQKRKSRPKAHTAQKQQQCSRGMCTSTSEQLREATRRCREHLLPARRRLQRVAGFSVPMSSGLTR